MPAPSTLMRAARPAFRQQFFTQAQSARTARTKFQFAGRRWQSTTAEGQAVQQGWIKRMWDSPIGLKTVHFWAPVMKWCIVIAGISDLARPAEKLSLTQNLALTATGIIWTRWCMIIKPRNILLATVNFFLGIVGVAQVTRILLWRRSQKGETAGEMVEEAKADVVDSAKALKAKAEAVVKS